MDFNLTEEQNMLRDTLGRFLGDRYSHKSRQKLIASGEAYDQEIFSGLAGLGVLGALFDADHGGFGGAGFDLSVVFEELGRAGVIEPFLPAVLAGGLIAEAGRTNVVDEIIAGTHVAALAHGEPGSRYDLSHVESSAVLDGAQAQTLVVSARESGEVRDEEGISLFLVFAGGEGVTVVNHVNVDGTSGATVTLESVRVSVSARLGAAGAAFSSLETAVARCLTALCAEALGAMEAAKVLTIEYLKDRKQFGIPIGKFQALQHRMADMLIEIEQARSAVINLAGNLDQPRAIRERHVSATKNLIGRVGAMVAEECTQMHGGIGMTHEYAQSQFSRRLTKIDHMFGDVDYHLERFIALRVR